MLIEPTRLSFSQCRPDEIMTSCQFTGRKKKVVPLRSVLYLCGDCYRENTSFQYQITEIAAL